MTIYKKVFKNGNWMNIQIGWYFLIGIGLEFGEMSKHIVIHLPFLRIAALFW